MVTIAPFGSTKNFYCCRYFSVGDKYSLLEVLRISTVVDSAIAPPPYHLLEVLRISTVVDSTALGSPGTAFGSTKNFYSCRSHPHFAIPWPFGSTKNFYCCR